MGKSMSRRQAGFTLLEVLIALTILCAALGVFYQALSIGGRTDHTAELTARAAMFAQSKMATLGVSEKLVAGVTQGQNDAGFAWQLDVEDRSAAFGASSRRLTIYEITLNISWDGKERLQFRSLRADAARDM